MKRIASFVIAAIVGLATCGPAPAHAAPVVTAATGSADVVTATVAVSGCRLATHRTPRGVYVTDGVLCPGPTPAGQLLTAFPVARYTVNGTNVQITTPAMPACDTPFTITIAGTVAYTDTLGGTCPPPAPVVPAVIAARAGTTVTFTNPAGVDQAATFEYLVPTLAGVTFTADSAFTATPMHVRSGTANDPHDTYWYHLVVTVPAGATVTVVQS